MEDAQEEQKWAFGTLSLFVIMLIVSGISDFVEVGIGVFSIDFLIFLSCLIVCELNLKKLDEKK